MRPPRPFVWVGSEDAWLRCAHSATALVDGVLQLAWTDPQPSGGVSDPGVAAGLAFDRECRLYHSLPQAGQVERILWAASDAAEPLELFETPQPERWGEFHPSAPPGAALREPRGLAVDDNDRLFIGEAGGASVMLKDLWDRQLLARVPVPGRPLDLAMREGGVVVLLGSPAGLVEMNARTNPKPLALPAGAAAPARVAVNDAGEIFVLDSARTAGARVLAGGFPAIPVPDASDLEFQPGGVLVVARSPGEDFRRYRVSVAATEELPPLTARNYDGLGIVLAPDGRIAYWTPRGVRHAIPARPVYASEGRATTFRLDCGEFHTRWGRIFMDACIPKNTSVRISCTVADEPPDGPSVPRTPPANTLNATVIRPDLSPPMPPLSLAPADAPVPQLVHHRETGLELPWAAREDATFETYEAPVSPGPGRFLWVTLLLSGNTQFTPRIRSVRAEYPVHDYMERLPKLYSRDELPAAFLRRYLAMFDGELGDLEAKSVWRHVLVDPRSAPASLLPWLASFVGLLFDERWPEACRRTLVEEAVWLFRYRGTIKGLSRFLEIYLGVSVILLENWRLRGVEGRLGRNAGDLASNSILGAGFRIGGLVGSAQDTMLGTPVEDAFETHAHRFMVIIPAVLTAEQSDVVQHILDVHRPAHTLIQVCSVGAGMRVGQGLNVELTSIIGPTGRFRQLQLDAALLGRDRVLGRPRPGTSLGGSRLGADSRIG
jgi:phage tail-like protein